MAPFWRRRTTHLRLYFSEDWDVHWGYDLGFDPWPFHTKRPFFHLADPGWSEIQARWSSSIGHMGRFFFFWGTRFSAVLKGSQKESQFIFLGGLLKGDMP